MVQIAIKPIILTNVLLKIGTDDYAKHVSRVEFVPSSSSTSWKGLSAGESHTFMGSATWTCGLEYAQDWETEDSLSLYLHEHEGETKSCEFEPAAGGAKWTADIVIVPGAIGGAVDQVATASVTLGVSGKPTFTPAPEPDPEPDPE